MIIVIFFRDDANDILAGFFGNATSNIKRFNDVSRLEDNKDHLYFIADEKPISISKENIAYYQVI